jgi:hypothetical protein
MSDYAQYVQLPATKRADRWVGITSIGPILIGGAQPDVALARVRMQFRLGAVVYTLDTEGTPDAPIVIDNGTTWLISIAAIETGIFETAGKWTFDIEFYGTGQGSVTYIKGDIQVYSDITTA